MATNLSKKTQARLATAATIDLAGHPASDTAVIAQALAVVERLAAAIATCYEKGEYCITLADAEAMLK